MPALALPWMNTSVCSSGLEELPRDGPEFDSSFYSQGLGVPETEQALNRYLREGGKEVRKERGSREGNLFSERPGLGPTGKFLARKLLICLPCFSYLLALITPTPSFGVPPSPIWFWWDTNHKVLPLLSWGRPVTHPDFCSQKPNFDERALWEKAWRGGPQTQP